MMGRHDNIFCQQCGEKIPQYAMVCRYCRQSTPQEKIRSGYNRFGVPRDIPPDIKKVVREECGFGCVVCGEFFVHYDHFEPEYAELEVEHLPTGIALLCPNHHSRRNGDSPALTTAKVKELRANPFAKQTGNAAVSKIFFETPGPSGLCLGGINVFKGTMKILVNDSVLFAFEEPEPNDLYRPVKFTANFQKQDGTPLLSIMGNEVTVSVIENFDLVTESSKIVLRENGETIFCVSRHGKPVLDEDSTAIFSALLDDKLVPDWAMDMTKNLVNHDALDVFNIEIANVYLAGKHIEIGKQAVIVDGVTKFDGSVSMIAAGPNAMGCINF